MQKKTFNICIVVCSNKDLQQLTENFLSRHCGGVTLILRNNINPTSAEINTLPNICKEKTVSLNAF